MRVAIPHSLGKDEVRRRMQEKAGKASAKASDLLGSLASVDMTWRDDDHLMLQGPTFAVRDFYRRHGIPPLNWRVLPDDHLVHELSFIAHLLERREKAAALEFLDHHLLVWLPQFAARVAQQLNLFAIGFPITLSVGLVGVLLTLPMMQAPFTMALERMLQHFQ